MTAKDLQALEGGQALLSSWIEVSQNRINAFADVTMDRQFIHLDPDRARAETPFGGTIAHGFLTLSLMSAMAGEVMPPAEGTAMVVNYGLNRVRFISPVPSGARVRGRFVLKETDGTVPGQVTLIWTVTVEIEGRDKPALAAEWIARRYLEGKA